VYAAHFNLREPPFSIAPDPAFLYLSARHQEALGHLLYGTGQYGGFVQLTGEVGTGKTTIVRTLLAQKLDNVDVAMIHNPRQSEAEFVASICDELGVAYERPATSIKILVDALNEHLLGTHAAGRRTVLIIDEAQNLAPAVLEQVRLLTNLETDKEKLLRIMLIGQPELIELLGRAELRQLASRITARYHLVPLSPSETARYVRHRLAVAGGGPDIFGEAAMRRVHRYSGGVPRLINIVCDRALLGAYGQGQRMVTPEIVDRAASEALGTAPVATARRSWRALLPQRVPLRWIEGALAVAALTVAGVLLIEMLSSRPRAATVPPVGATAPIVPPASASIAAPAPSTTPGPTAAASLAPPATAEDATAPATIDADLGALRATAQPLPPLIERLIGLWDPNIVIPRGANVCRALAAHGLECERGTGHWSDLAQINRPAILTLTAESGQLQYVLLRSLGSGTAVLDTSRGPLRLAQAQLDQLWGGEYLVLWKRETAETEIGPNSRGAGVAWVRQRLAQADGKTLAAPIAESYDADLRAQLIRFQSAHGLDADGIAGTRTLIALADVNPSPGTPTLVENGG
jgi:general secretion pathway protein A